MYLELEPEEIELVARVQKTIRARGRKEVMRRALLAFAEIVDKGNGEYIVCGQVRRLEMPR